MNKPQILVVEDDVAIGNLITTTLETQNYQYHKARTGAAAILEAASSHPDVILLDLGLPDMDGVDIIKKVRSWSNTPIIVVSARSEDMDKVSALDAGADDYITKPFSVRELIARVKALLRRAAPQNEEEGILHVGGLTIDVGNYEAFRNGEKLSLTLKEFELLKLLVLSRGKVLTRDFLLDRIWGYEFYGETRTVDVHIRHIRQKLGDDAHYIETIRGVGYKFNDRQENRL